MLDRYRLNPMSSTTKLSPAAETHLPGEAGVWMFIIGDMLMFSLLFSVFVYYRSDDVALFSTSQQALSQTYGLFNTILMLTSSWFVALAIHSQRQRLVHLTTRFLVLAVLCGLGFIVVKVFEYSEKFAANLTIVTNDFFMYYYMLTGIHLLHVVLGIIVLLYVCTISRRSELSADDVNMLESGASFWHMVDMLWIVLFALLYLMR
jgi:nitric oxide reductase NorE protein